MKTTKTALMRRAIEIAEQNGLKFMAVRFDRTNHDRTVDIDGVARGLGIDILFDGCIMMSVVRETADGHPTTPSTALWRYDVPQTEPLQSVIDAVSAEFAGAEFYSTTCEFNQHGRIARTPHFREDQFVELVAEAFSKAREICSDDVGPGGATFVRTVSPVAKVDVTDGRIDVVVTVNGRCNYNGESTTGFVTVGRDVYVQILHSAEAREICRSNSWPLPDSVVVRVTESGEVAA